MTQTTPSQADNSKTKQKNDPQALAQGESKTETASLVPSLSRPLSSSLVEQSRAKKLETSLLVAQLQNSQSKHPFKSKAKAFALAFAICMVPIVIETAAYYFGDRWLSNRGKQENIQEQKQPFPMLLISASATAMVAGGLAALLANRSGNSEVFPEASTEQTKREESLLEAIYKIHESQKPEDVLKITVEEARRIISVERVLVYSLNEASQGLVIAESVASGWPVTWGARIDDPCFSTHYMEKYQNGRIQAIEDIYAANLTPCYLSQLETFGVRAGLVVPIIDRGKLLGLLIAHQCSQPRSWREWEIETFTQIATQAGLALSKANILGEYTHLQKQAETEDRWKKLLANATWHIHASLKQEDILKATVEQAREAIAADRVLIYSLERQSRFQIIAESVDSDWPKALGAVLEDPCFNSYYLEKYQNGRIRAIEDIYSANLSVCHLRQLEPFAVKASLIVPLLDRKQVIGLLIAHQCSGPRTWQQAEIEVFNQIAMQAGLAVNKAQLLNDSARHQKEAETENHWLKSFTEAAWHIRASLNEEEVLRMAVEQARSAIGADRVVIYSLDRQSQGIVIAESVAHGWPKSMGARIDDPCFSTHYVEKYQNGRVRAMDDVYAANLTPCYLGQLEPFAVKASLVVPIINQGKLLGLLIAHQCSGPRAWQQFEIRCFAQIAMHIGFAINDARLWQWLSKMSENTLESRQERDILQRKASTLLQESETALEIFANDFSAMQQTITEAAKRVKLFGQSSQKIYQAVSYINHLTTQMSDRALNAAIEAGKMGDAEQAPVVSLAEMVRSVTHELTTAAAEVEPLIAEMATEANQMIATIETKTQQVVNETELVKEAQNKLSQIAYVNAKINALLQTGESKIPD
jgi:methyl-accepting chemotaxis protein PixJ